MRESHELTLDRYQLISLLGRGGMAEVYKAYQPGLDRYVAVKLLHPHLAYEPGFISRFEREAASVARLRHPNIVQVIDFDCQDGRYYMVMEFIEGASWRAVGMAWSGWVEVSTGEELLHLDFGEKVEILLSPDGEHMAVVRFGEGSVSVFPMWGTLEELQELARDCCVVRELTPDECAFFGLPEQ